MRSKVVFLFVLILFYSCGVKEARQSEFILKESTVNKTSYQRSILRSSDSAIILEEQFDLSQADTSLKWRKVYHNDRRNNIARFVFDSIEIIYDTMGIKIFSKEQLREDLTRITYFENNSRDRVVVRENGIRVSEIKLNDNDTALICYFTSGKIDSCISLQAEGVRRAVLDKYEILKLGVQINDVQNTITKANTGYTK